MNKNEKNWGIFRNILCSWVHNLQLYWIKNWGTALIFKSHRKRNVSTGAKGITVSRCHSIYTFSARDRCHGNRCRVIFGQHHNPHCCGSLQAQIITRIFKISKSSLGESSLIQHIVTADELETWSWPFGLHAVSLKWNLAGCLLRSHFLFLSVFSDKWL